MRIIVFTIISLLLASCGSKKKSKQPQISRGFPQQLNQTASDFSIPSRLLKAVAFLESRIQPEPYSMTYEDKVLSFERTQTALGLSRSTLSLQEQENSSALLVQFKAYAAFMHQRLQNQNLQFNRNPKTPDEWFHWLWEMAQLHRQGSRTRRNTHVIFVREMMQILNEGFVKTLPSGEALTLSPQSPPLQEKDFSPELQKYLKLSSNRSPIDGVLHLNLVADSNANTPLAAQSIEVVHCPFSLSTCLDLQSPGLNDQVRMQAHYLIPQSDALTGLPLEVSRHDHAVEITSTEGNIEMSDRIVVMLTGHSGHTTGSTRSTAHPTWLTPWQLTSMAQVIHAICQRLEWDHNSSAEACIQQTKFRQASSSLTWGDISDYDPMIFNAYLQNPTGLLGEVSLNLQNKSSRISAGQQVNLQIHFQPQAQQIILEELSRCDNGRMVWSLFYKSQVRNQTRQEIKRKLWDSGPNRDGTHYFRMKAYNKDGDLMGWDMTRALLKDFEKEGLSASPDACLVTATEDND